MKPSRREFLAFAAQAAACLSAGAASASEGAVPLHELGLGVVIHSYGIRAGQPGDDGFSNPRVFFGYCQQLGAAGIQTNLTGLGVQGAEQLRAEADAARMYLEGIVALPRDREDVARFAAELRIAELCGAKVVRTVMLPGRRYETFDSLAAFQAFAKESYRRLELAKGAVEKQSVLLAVENHKDWRVEEMLEILRRIDCPMMGVCVDTGNSIALLEEPHEVVDAYAPVAFTTHFKDMAVQEYADGFLLSEIPLGHGFLDLPRIIKSLRAARPDVHLNLEMITRDPLRVPCLTEKYWATFTQVSGSDFAKALRNARVHSALLPLPEIKSKSVAERLRFEDDNVRASLAFASAALK